MVFHELIAVAVGSTSFISGVHSCARPAAGANGNHSVPRTRKVEIRPVLLGLVWVGPTDVLHDQRELK